MLCFSSSHLSFRVRPTTTMPPSNSSQVSTTHQCNTYPQPFRVRSTITVAMQLVHQQTLRIKSFSKTTIGVAEAFTEKPFSSDFTLLVLCSFLPFHRENMAEIFLSATIQVLFEKLLSPNLINYVEHREEVHTAMEKWKMMLMTIRAVLVDAEEQQITNPVVKIWLNELRDLAYDVEDILDDFATEASRRNLMAEPQARTSKIQSLIPTCCTTFKPSTVLFNFEMKSKIKEITTRLEQIVTQKSQLELRENAGGTSSRTRERRAIPTSSVEESRVYGRETDKETVLELLLRGEASGNEVCVIPIIGMGGIGKTTLARLVYNDDRVRDNFPLQGWACVSEESDIIQVTKTILESFTFQASNVNDLNSLQVKLKELLSKKKFLLVIDDVWHANYECWTILRRPLEAGAPGSKIIVTTRNEGVSKTMGTVPPFPLKGLSNDDCISIFTQHALGTRDFDAHPNLKQTGELIVKSCRGLPLAAKALGGLLRSSVNLDEWKDVLNSTIWDLPEDKCGVIPALRLSYLHLPPNLKQCFAFCSIFPKDYEFEEEELVLLWLAVGLVQQRDESKQMEDVGDGYFHDLLSRSFFQISSINESRFVMHDLINDLAQWVAGETCFRLEDTLGGKKRCKISKKSRHSSCVGSHFYGIKKFEAFDEAKSLRTFLALPTPCWYISYLTNYVPRDLLPELKCLRVLSLRKYHITELPNSIGDLKHLRYLDLSGTHITCLPESTSSLYNLQILVLKDCSRLKKLPTAMGNLINLRFLDITDANLIKEMPPRVGKLTNLRKLSNFIVGNDSGGGIKELMNLKHLRGVLCISGLENVIDAQDAREANLKDKWDLNVLSMGWSLESNDSRIEGVEREVLDLLQPHKKLKELTIKCYRGMTLPTWVGDPSFSNLVFLKLENCAKCTSLPPLGQLPLLKELWIEGMNGINTVGLEFYGEGCPMSFPSLEILSFEDMQEWQEWSPCGVNGQVEAFHHLRKLSIKNGPKLIGKLPDHLPSLDELIINECQHMAVSIQSLPKLKKLDIQGCQEVVQRSTDDLNSLKSMVLSNVSKLTCLTEDFLRGLTKVEDVEIVRCNELTSLWQKEAGLLQNLTSIRRLKIKGCPNFVSLAAEEVEQQQQVGLPCRLESLELESCDSLEKLQGLRILTSLRVLKIKQCPGLVSFPETGLPSALRELRIDSCNALKSLPLMHCNNHDSLEELYISECPNLMFLLLRGELPVSLKNLYVSDCGLLESVVERVHNNTCLESILISHCESLKSLPEGLHNLTHLSYLGIWMCPSLVSFPDGGLPSTTLRELWISDCEKLEALPDRMHHLTSLQQLSIVRCRGIVSFPEEGFPTNLTELCIEDLNICNPLFEWGLHRFTSLKSLSIWDCTGGCPDLVSFPEEEKGMILPSCLTGLGIRDFPNLKYLSSRGFQNLTFLKSLSIWDCPKLKSFPEGFQNLTSLEYLWIGNCPKLKSFPDEGLPPSLLQLHITNCPLLKQRCKKDKGRDWPKIAHIPEVKIDRRFIYDPET